MNNGVYAKDGKLVEIHHLPKKGKELYILLDQKEPRVFQVGEKELEIVSFDNKQKELRDMIREGEKEFRKIRLKQLFKPTSPPVITFFENIIDKKGIETIKQGLKETFLNKAITALQILTFITENYSFEHYLKMKETDAKDCLEIQFYIPFYYSFSSHFIREKMNKKQEWIGSIYFVFEKENVHFIESMRIKEIL